MPPVPGGGCGIRRRGGVFVLLEGAEGFAGEGGPFGVLVFENAVEFFFGEAVARGHSL